MNVRLCARAWRVSEHICFSLFVVLLRENEPLSLQACIPAPSVGPLAGALAAPARAGPARPRHQLYVCHARGRCRRPHARARSACSGTLRRARQRAVLSRLPARSRGEPHGTLASAARVRASGAARRALMAGARAAACRCACSGAVSALARSTSRARSGTAAARRCCYACGPGAGASVRRGLPPLARGSAAVHQAAARAALSCAQHPPTCLLMPVHVRAGLPSAAVAEAAAAVAAAAFGMALTAAQVSAARRPRHVRVFPQPFDAEHASSAPAARRTPCGCV